MLAAVRAAPPTTTDGSVRPNGAVRAPAARAPGRPRRPRPRGRGLGGRDPHPLPQQLPGGQVHRRALDAAAADVDTEAERHEGPLARSGRLARPGRRTCRRAGPADDRPDATPPPAGGAGGSARPGDGARPGRVLGRARAGGRTRTVGGREPVGSRRARRPALPHRTRPRRCAWAPCERGLLVRHAHRPARRREAPARPRSGSRSPGTGRGRLAHRHLVANPGGPGSSAVEWLQGSWDSFPKAVRDRFDLVAFDPRGVGRTAPVRCLTTAQLDRYFPLDPLPDSAAEQGALDAATSSSPGAGAAPAGSCRTSRPRRWRPDLERVRIALGDPSSPTSATPTARRSARPTSTASRRTSGRWCSTARSTRR